MAMMMMKLACTRLYVLHPFICLCVCVGTSCAFIHLLLLPPPPPNKNQQATHSKRWRYWILNYTAAKCKMAKTQTVRGIFGCIQNIVVTAIYARNICNAIMMMMQIWRWWWLPGSLVVDRRHTIQNAVLPTMKKSTIDYIIELLWTTKHATM